jgi:hypothetical protein
MLRPTRSLPRVLPVVRQLQASGLTTLRELAEALNARHPHSQRRGVASERGAQSTGACDVMPYGPKRCGCYGSAGGMLTPEDNRIGRQARASRAGARNRCRLRPGGCVQLGRGQERLGALRFVEQFTGGLQLRRTRCGPAGGSLTLVSPDRLGCLLNDLAERNGR